MSSTWKDLERCLEERNRDAAPLRFWLRDDDAISDTGPLRALGAWAERHETEILLAVVPEPAEASLTTALGEMPALRACLHGWAHKNHAPPDQKKQELGDHRPTDLVCEELSRGWTRLLQFAADTALPVLVPPWNRMAAAVVDQLPELGLQGISVFAEAFTRDAPDTLKVRNCHLDIVDWRGTRGGRNHAGMIEELIGHVNSRAKAEQPIGVLTHHLVHDEAAWSFLGDLGKCVHDHPDARWAGPSEIFGC